MKLRKPPSNGLLRNAVLVLVGLFALHYLLVAPAKSSPCSLYEGTLANAPTRAEWNSVGQRAAGRVVLVTGAAGFIGSHVAATCARLGMVVVAVDDLSGGFMSNVPRGVTFVKGDVKDAEFVEELFDEYDFEYVYHLAAYAAEGLSHFIRTYNYRNNLVSSVSLINQAVRAGTVKCFVFTSSIAVYGAGQTPLTEETIPIPEDPYGISKYAVELDLKAAHEMFGLNHVIFRPHNVYGPGQNMFDKYRNVIGIFLNQLMAGKSLTVFGDGHQTRKFSYIDDVAWPMAIAPLFQHNHNQVFNVGANTAYTLNQLADMTITAWNAANTEVVHLEARNEVVHAESSHDKLHCFFPALAAPTGLAAGLERMVAWVRKDGKYFKPVQFEAVEVMKKMPPSWITPELREVAQVEHGEADNLVARGIGNLQGAVDENKGSLTTEAALVPAEQEAALPEEEGPPGKNGTYTSRHVCAWRTPSCLSRLQPWRQVADAAVEAADRFQEQLCAEQGGAASLVVVVAEDAAGAGAGPCGLVCRLLRRQMALWSTLHDRGVLAAAPLGEAAAAAEEPCSAEDDECHLQPIAARGVEALLADSAARAAHLLAQARAGDLAATDGDDYVHRGIRLFSRSHVEAFRYHDHFGVPWLREDLGRRTAAAGRSGCWVAAQLLYYMLQPSAKVEAAVAREKERLGWGVGRGARCAAVHVAGRAAGAEPEVPGGHLPLATFVDSVKRDPTLRRILLVTEDQTVIDEAQEKYPEYEWLYTQQPRPTHAAAAHRAEGEAASAPEALTDLVNLLLSSECEYFVGKSSSAWFRVMVLLGYGKHGAMPPFDDPLEEWTPPAGPRNDGFFGTCTLAELKKEVSALRRKFPALVRMDPQKIHCREGCSEEAKQ